MPIVPESVSFTLAYLSAVFEQLPEKGFVHLLFLLGTLVSARYEWGGMRTVTVGYFRRAALVICLTLFFKELAVAKFLKYSVFDRV